MTHPAHLSRFQYVHHADGGIVLDGLPNVHIETILEQGAVQGRNWQQELKLPTYHEEWEFMAQAVSLKSGRRVLFVLMDESVTRLKGNPVLQPKNIMLPYPLRCPLTLSHTGFVVGTVDSFLLISDQDRDREALKKLGIDWPDFTEGQWILSEAELFDSALADAAWNGCQNEIFSHVCPVLFTKLGEPIGAGELVEVALTPGDYPGSQNAKVLKTWEA